MRLLKIGVLTILGLLVIVGLSAYFWLRSSLPDLDGTVTLAGPSAEIRIYRDSHGVPHIDAASDNDLYFAMGYVHAQDRLWQMEMNRRLGNGRVSEAVGKAGLGFDKYFRTLGFARKAEAALKQLPPEIVASLQAYADGVNAYVGHHGGALPPEFLLTGVTPEPWRPVDTIVWQKLMWLDLSGNMRQEVARARLLTKLSRAQVESLYPAYPGDEALPLPELADIYADAPVQAISEIVGAEPPPGYGSNNWVVSGAHTKSGKPLLANDPHLGLTTPSIWYLVRLHNRTTDSNLVGVSFPGTPSIVLGRNDKIAWGFTNTAPDIQDLYLEKLVDGGTRYLTPEGPADFITHKEIIHVKDADDVVLNVRETRHGPVLSDISTDKPEFLRDGYVFALQWTALMDQETAVMGLFGLAKAHDFEAFKAAGQFYMGPEQNMVYADTDGNIGYYAPALVPIRKAGNTIGGRMPSPGWLADYDWQGFIPYNELPTRFNPESGIIATANEKIVDKDYPYFITGDWALPYRGNRIRHLLSSRKNHDMASFRQIQQDVVSDMAQDLLPWFVANTHSNHPALAALHAWDGHMDANKAEPLIFHTWIRLYQEALMKDELGGMYADFGRVQARLMKSGLYWSAKDAGSNHGDDAYYALPALDHDISLAWCDDVTTTDRKETCSELAQAAFEATLKELAEKHGPEWHKWRWSDEHVLHQEHRPMSNVPQMKPYFELSAPVSGSTHTINVSGVSRNPASLNQSSFGPSYRGIFDLSDLDASLYVQPTGQSGNPLSDHFDDLFPLWRKGQYFTIPTATVKPDDTEHTLVLQPARP
ncbi:MAG: penicillin acylase family protein [Alphaproteobacteria bacterium]|nr:MAG: penicillin acylase family protein [Alphaproteobacteria bacterium]